VDPFEQKLLHSFDDFSLSLNCLGTVKSKTYLETETRIQDCQWGRGDTFILVLTQGNILNFYKKNSAKGVFDYLSSLVDKYKQISEEIIIHTDSKEYLEGEQEQHFKCKEKDEKLREIKKYLKEDLGLEMGHIQQILDGKDDSKLVELYNTVLVKMSGEGKKGKMEKDNFKYDLFKIVNLCPLIQSTLSKRVNSFQLEMLLYNMNSEDVFCENEHVMLNSFSEFLKKNCEKSLIKSKDKFQKILISPNNEFVFLLSESGKMLTTDFFCSGKNLVSKQVFIVYF
jgi:hypothetical protein